MRRADVAMYRGQAEQRARACTRREDESTPERLKLSASCAARSRRNELVVHYQPKVDLRDGPDRRRRGAGALAATPRTA